MTRTDPDLAAIFAQHAEHEARAAALRPANRTRLFDALAAAGIAHVTVTFDGAGDSGQIESVTALAGDTPIDLPATLIAWATLAWNAAEVEVRQLSLEAAIEALAFELLGERHGGWEINDGAWGEFCFSTATRSIHLQFNERFTTSQLFTHTF